MCSACLKHGAVCVIVIEHACRAKLAMFGLTIRRLNGRQFDALIVIRIDADLVLLGGERVLARVDRTQLVLILQIGPPVYAAVDDMGQAFAVRDLQSAVQGPSDRDALTRRVRIA